PSSRRATDDILCVHQCPVPSFADPSPSARPSGVRRSLIGITTASQEQPVEDRQHECAGNDGPGSGIGLWYFEAVTQVPDEMTYAASQVEKEGETERRKQDPAANRLQQFGEAAIGFRPVCSGHKPGGEHEEPEGKENTGAAVQYRHHHRDRPAINEQVRRQGPSATVYAATHRRFHCAIAFELVRFCASQGGRVSEIDASSLQLPIAEASRVRTSTPPDFHRDRLLFGLVISYG